MNNCEFKGCKNYLVAKCRKYDGIELTRAEMDEFPYDLDWAITHQMHDVIRTILLQHEKRIKGLELRLINCKGR